MLLSVPAIAGAGLLVAAEIWQSGNYENLHYALSGIGYSFIASIAAIFIMMKWLTHIGHTFLKGAVSHFHAGIYVPQDFRWMTYRPEPMPTPYGRSNR